MHHSQQPLMGLLGVMHGLQGMGQRGVGYSTTTRTVTNSTCDAWLRNHQSAYTNHAYYSGPQELGLVAVKGHTSLTTNTSGEVPGLGIRLVGMRISACLRSGNYLT